MEPMDAWETHENAWRPAARPASPGWDPEDAAEIARLWARELELAEVLVCHPYWTGFAPGDVQTARDALKHHREQESASTAS
ncbi:nucleic acid-binding protein [Streptomyces sp. NPDC020794]|uniref:nucleic acid-binding protein n=1 Tax=unclassified Streptomyces TaxID=2593676 RepID=UPI0036E38E28